MESLVGFGKALKKIEEKDKQIVIPEEVDSQATIEGGHEFFNGLEDQAKQGYLKYDSKFIMF